MKFSRYVRLTLASAMMLGVSAMANATYHPLGSALLPSGSLGNTFPGDTVTVGDTMHLDGVWDGSQGNCSPCISTWYFTTAIPNLFLDDARLHEDFTGSFTAELFSPSSVSLTTFFDGVPQYMIPLTAVGTYKLVITIIDSGTHTRSFGWDADVVPLPAAAWLLLSGVAGLGAMARRRKVAAEA